MKGRLASFGISALGLLWLGLTPAQTPPADALHGGPTNAAAAVPVPPLPPLKSPVDLFRDLLAMDAAERQHALADRAPEVRARIAAKLREYQALSPEQRELLLKVTELRFYLWPLMNVAPTNRAEQLLQIPAEDRRLVEERLEQWDRLSPEAQEQFRDSEVVVRHLSQPRERQAAALQRLPAAQRQQLELAIQRWQQLRPEQQRTVTDRFSQYFNLSPGEKERTLRTLSDPERRQIEKTLRTFETLSRSQRAQCIASFEKLARMSPEELQQFLKNAAQWERMTPSERRAWRDLLYKISPPPPLPPAWRFPPPPPPLPPTENLRPGLVATNR